MKCCNLCPILVYGVALPVPSWCGLFPYWLIHLSEMLGFGCRFSGWMMVYHVIVTAVVGDGFPDSRFTGWYAPFHRQIYRGSVCDGTILIVAMCDDRRPFSDVWVLSVVTMLRHIPSVPVFSVCFKFLMIMVAPFLVGSWRLKMSAVYVCSSVCSYG